MKNFSLQKSEKNFRRDANWNLSITKVSKVRKNVIASM